MKSVSYREMIDILQRQRGLALVGHESPDCDCLGSMLALFRAFEGRDKGWVMLLRDPAPDNLRFLPGLELMIDPDRLTEQPQAFLFVDHGEAERAGAWLAPLLKGQPIYCIDHHATNDFQGEASICEEDAAAAAEIVAALIFAAGMEPDDETALCLYSGIAADTGCFRYLNTTARCFELSARLVDQVDLELVRISLFEDRSYANLKMMAACLNNLVTACEGKLCYSYISAAQRGRFGAQAEDCHNIVNYTLVLSGVKMGLLFEEYEDEVKISFRCRRGWRVDELARRFNGGGHKLAAGCKTRGKLADIIPQVVEEATRLFE